MVLSINKKDVELLPVTRSTTEAVGIAQFVRNEQLKTPRRYDDAIHLIVQQNITYDIP